MNILLHEDFSDLNSAPAKALLDHRYIEFMPKCGRNGGNAIRVSYVGFDMGSDRVCVDIPLSEKVMQATLSFDVKFAHNFQFVISGKLHGVGPVAHVAGGRQRRPDGWSSRITFRSHGGVSHYLYDQDLAKKWGFGKEQPNPVFEPGEWAHVILQTSLNTPNQPDGWARTIINGRETLFDDGVCFRGKDGDETRISKLLFHTFHGGNTPDCAPKDDNGNYTTVYALFANFLVTEGIRDCTPKLG